MIRMVSGNVQEQKPGMVVVDVGGLGYLVHVPGPYSFTHGESVSLCTHLAVRETALDLYGFKTNDELRMFELLLTLPKIGPKTALAVMDQADIALIKKAVASDDPAYLSKMSGLGKKSAEKIVAGLKEKFEDEGLGDEGGMALSDESDIVDALIALGYSERSAREAVRKLPQDIADQKARITAALKILSS